MSAPTQTKSYGKRTCMHCHKDFEAFKPSTVTCSPKCHKARRRELDRALKQKRLKPDNLDWLNNEYEELKADRMEVSDILLASAFMDFAEADDEVEWLNCRLETALAMLAATGWFLRGSIKNAAPQDMSHKEAENDPGGKNGKNTEKVAPIVARGGGGKSQKNDMEDWRPEFASPSDTRESAVTVSVTKNNESQPQEEADAKKGSGKFRHICANCGCWFKSTRKDDKFCDDACRIEAASFRM